MDDKKDPQKPLPITTPEVQALMQDHRDDGLTDLHDFPLGEEEKRFEELRKKRITEKNTLANKGSKKLGVPKDKDSDGRSM